MFPKWVRATMHHLSSCETRHFLVAWEVVANIFGEILAAGVRNNAADTVHAVLPFDVESAEAMLSPDTLSGEAAMAICFDLLNRYILPLFIARAEEALDINHPYHIVIWTKNGQIVQAMKRNYMPMRAAAVTDAPPPDPDHDDAALVAATKRRADLGGEALN